MKLLGAQINSPDSPGGTQREAQLQHIESINGSNYLTLQFSVSASATQASVTFQVSSNLVDWLSGPPNSELMWNLSNIDGTIAYKFRDTAPAQTTPVIFFGC